MVDERLRPLVRRQVQLDEHPLDVEQVPLERVQEPARLQVLRRRASVPRNRPSARPTEERREYVRTHTEMPSSLMIYPIPNPSAATGPNPNSLSAGFPQLDVERMDRLRRCQPWSVKIDGNGGFSRARGVGGRANLWLDLRLLHLSSPFLINVGRRARSYFFLLEVLVKRLQ